jgi:hypothetical protein
MQSIYIDLPLKNYLKKYITKRLNIADDEYLLSVNDSLCFGMYLLPLLQKKRDFYETSTNCKIQEFVKSLDQKINIYLKPMYIKKCGLFLTYEKIFYINKYLDGRLRDEINIFIQANKLFTPNFVTDIGLNNFLAIYNINAKDINEDSVLRDYYRKKKKFSYVE